MSRLQMRRKDAPWPLTVEKKRAEQANAAVSGKLRSREEVEIAIPNRTQYGANNVRVLVRVQYDRTRIPIVENPKLVCVRSRC